jgi:hypothetical protein
MKKLLLVCALAAFAVLPALAADNPWVGTWKLDPAKSHFTGDTFTYSKNADGMMHFSDGSTINYDFGIDGKEYKTHENRTVSWTADGDHAWTEVAKADSTTLATTHVTLSDDSKTLTFNSTGTQPDGTAFNDEAVYTRESGTSGLAGKWRSTKVTISAPDTFIVKSSEPGTLNWDIPGYKETVGGKADGSDLPITGPTVPPGLTLSVKFINPRRLSYIVKINGKPEAYGSQTLSSDGTSFTDVSWNPGKTSEKQTGVYIKQ